MAWIKHIFRSNKTNNLSDNQSQNPLEDQIAACRSSRHSKDSRQSNSQPRDTQNLSDCQVNEIVDSLITQINSINQELHVNQGSLIHKSFQLATDSTIRDIDKYLSIEIDNEKVDLTSPQVQVFELTREETLPLSTCKTLKSKMNTAGVEDTTPIKVSNLFVAATTPFSEEREFKGIESNMPTFPKTSARKENAVPVIDDDWCVTETAYTDPGQKNTLKFKITDSVPQNIQLVDKISPPKKVKGKKAKPEFHKSDVVVAESSNSAAKSKQSTQFTGSYSSVVDEKPEFTPEDLYLLSQNKLDLYEPFKSENDSNQCAVDKLSANEGEKNKKQIDKPNECKLNRRDKTVDELSTTARIVDQLDTTIDAVEDDQASESAAFPLDEPSNQIVKVNLVGEQKVQDESSVHTNSSKKHSNKMSEGLHFIENKVNKSSESLKLNDAMGTIGSKLADSTVNNKSDKVKCDFKDLVPPLTLPWNVIAAESEEVDDVESALEIKTDKKLKNGLLRMSQNVSSYFRGGSDLHVLGKFNNLIAKIKFAIITQSLRLILASEFIGLAFLLLSVSSNFWMANHINYEKSGIYGTSSTYIGLFGITRQDSCYLPDGASITLSRDLIKFNTISSYRDSLENSTQASMPAINLKMDGGSINKSSSASGIDAGNAEFDENAQCAERDVSEVKNKPHVEAGSPPFVYEKESEFIEKAGVFRDPRAVGTLSQSLAESRSKLFGYPFYDIEISGIEDLKFAGKLTFFLFIISTFVLLATVPLILMQYFPTHYAHIKLSRDGRIFVGYLSKALWISALILNLSGLLVMMIYTRSSTCVDKTGRSVPSSFSTSFWLAVSSFVFLTASYVFYNIKRNDMSPSNSITEFRSMAQLPLQVNERDTIYDNI